mmetsp:Transcript_29783/g.88384  ORF Transcript_29783/g.88384 Transcript_29783/m.88384 type:complete len:472 (+) Transcript_29783:1371-2786(+)
MTHRSHGRVPRRRRAVGRVTYHHGGRMGRGTSHVVRRRGHHVWRSPLRTHPVHVRRGRVSVRRMARRRIGHVCMSDVRRHPSHRRAPSRGRWRLARPPLLDSLRRGASNRRPPSHWRRSSALPGLIRGPHGHLSSPVIFDLAPSIDECLTPNVIEALDALALRSAHYPRLEALAVLLEACALFAPASHVVRHCGGSARPNPRAQGGARPRAHPALERVGVLRLGVPYGLGTYGVVGLVVVAVLAVAPVAVQFGREALTVQFEAFGFLAVARVALLGCGGRGDSNAAGGGGVLLSRSGRCGRRGRNLHGRRSREHQGGELGRRRRHPPGTRRYAVTRHRRRRESHGRDGSPPPGRNRRGPRRDPSPNLHGGAHVGPVTLRRRRRMAIGISSILAARPPWGAGRAWLAPHGRVDVSQPPALLGSLHPDRAKFQAEGTASSHSDPWGRRRWTVLLIQSLLVRVMPSSRPRRRRD